MGKTNIRKNMSNYYEILEVDKNASKEVIEKAYRTLAKKYHPDLRSSAYSQERMMKINEAYEVLSNDFKRKEYDNHLKEKNISIEEYNKIKQENIKLKNDLKRISNKYEPLQENEEYGSGITFLKKLYNGITKKTDEPRTTTVQKEIKISKEKLEKILTEKGKQVKQGDLIMEVGSTGNSTGPHCHFEVRINGYTQDPLKYVNPPGN